MNARKRVFAVVTITFLLLSAGYLFAAMNAMVPLPVASKKAPDANDFLKDAAYIGAKACQECHQKEHEVWSSTWHAKMLRKISPEIVVADFNNLEIAYSEVEVLDANKQKVKISPTITLKKEEDDFFLTLVDKDNEANNQTYPGSAMCSEATGSSNLKLRWAQLSILLPCVGSSSTSNGA